MLARMLSKVLYPEGVAVGSIPSEVLSQLGEDMPSAGAEETPTSSKMASSTSDHDLLTGGMKGS